MALRSTKRSLSGLGAAMQQAPGDTGLMNNMGLENRAVTDADAYYRDQEAKDFGNVQQTAEDWRQHGAAIQPGDPTGMRAFMQAMKERNAIITPRSGLDLPNSPMPLRALALALTKGKNSGVR